MDLKLFIFVLALKNKKKDHFITLTKSVSMTKELVNKSLYLLLNNKIAVKM